MKKELTSRQKAKHDLNRMLFGSATYGLNTTEVQNKSQASRKEKFGSTTGQMQTPEVRVKINNTLIERYGTLNGAMNTPEVHNLKKEKYGNVMGMCHTEEALKKRFDTCREKYGSANGAMLTPEALKKNKETFLRNGKTFVAVLQYDLTGKFIKEWRSAAIAADTLDIDRPSLTVVCQCKEGKQKTSGGFIWRYKHEALNPSEDLSKEEIEKLFVKKLKL